MTEKGKGESYREKPQNHDGDGVKKDATAADTINGDHSYQGEDQVSDGDGEGCEGWGRELELGENSCREVHEGVLDVYQLTKL